MRRALACAVLALAAVLAPGGHAIGAPPPAAADVRPPSLATPVLSARRVPVLLSRLAAESRLAASLDVALDDPALGPARQRSCLVVHDGRDPSRLLYQHNPETPLIPASTLKILTGVAVAERLGRAHRFTTEARVSADPADGVVSGDLWLVGGGDPVLATSDYAASFVNQPQLYTPLESLADAVVAAGVREIRGRIAGDESRYDAARYVATWKPRYITDSEVGPLSALLVNDGFTQFKPRRVAAPSPARHAAEVLTALLRMRGVTVTGDAATGEAPSDSVLLSSVESAPLADIVAQMLRESDNTTAELLVKELGRRFGGGGSWDQGLAVLRTTLANIGLPVDEFHAADGSGLDRTDRLTCRLLVAALAKAGPGSDVVAGFPVAGRTGTLTKRFVNGPLAGRMRAKTGSLDGVTGLVGYVDDRADATLLFALLANELPREALGRTLQERVGTALANHPDAPAAAELAPLPNPR